MPTFTYSFNRYKDYDKTYTKNTVSILTEYFRTTTAAEGKGNRTNDPIFSFFIKGYNQDQFKSKPLETCFSAGCVYDKLVKFRGKIILFWNRSTWLYFFSFLRTKSQGRL